MTRKARRALFVVTMIGAMSGVYVTTTNAITNLCETSNHLTDSDFEVDTSANLAVDGGSDCIDWLDDDGTGFRTKVVSKPDSSGNKDDAFGRGTAENDITPTIVGGSIPPNKSDLTNFGVFTESGPGGGNLALFWSRVQNPSGTTNMDFELNRLYCDPAVPAPTPPAPDPCADNGKGKRITPARTAGDKLISYDLTNGGTTPVISIRTWGGSSWGTSTVISGGADPGAVGSVNTSAISASPIGPLDAFTFGEAVISFETLFGPSCGSFGSAYLKSRSSDSFNAELKDFVAPEKVTISNCLASVSTQQFFYPNDSVTVSASDGTPQGTVTFELFEATDQDCDSGDALYTEADVTLDGTGTAETSNTSFRVTDSKTYKWKVSYNGGGDDTHDPVPGGCEGPETFSIAIDND